MRNNIAQVGYADSLARRSGLAWRRFLFTTPRPDSISPTWRPPLKNGRSPLGQYRGISCLDLWNMGEWQV